MLTVPGLTLITPDNKTTITDYGAHCFPFYYILSDGFCHALVNNYDPGSLNSNHWVGSNILGVKGKAVVDENTKVFNTNNLFVIDVSLNFLSN